MALRDDRDRRLEGRDQDEPDEPDELRDEAPPPLPEPNTSLDYLMEERDPPKGKMIHGD